MIQQTVIVGTLAIAQTLIILTAGIDLSIGAIMIFGQMLMANFAVYTTASNVLRSRGRTRSLRSSWASWRPRQQGPSMVS